MKPTIRSSLGRLDCKQAAAVQKSWTSQRNQYSECRLTTTTIKSFFVAGRIDDNENDKLQSQQRLSLSPRQYTLKSQSYSSAAEIRRSYHAAHSHERAPAIIMGLATVSAVGYAGASALKALDEWKNSKPTKEELEEIRKREE